MHRTFPTPRPVELHVEIGRGQVHVDAVDPARLVSEDGTATSTVEVSGPGSEEVGVEQDGDRLSVVAPRQRLGFLGGEPDLQVAVAVPTGSRLWARTGSADVRAAGRWDETRVKSGSGDVAIDAVAAAAVVETGSGDVSVDEVAGDLRVKTGSGDVRIGTAGRAVAVSSGSGDVAVDLARGPVGVKTGSGDLRVAVAHDDVDVTTASGDTCVEHVHRGRLTLKAASGDAAVGVPAGVPVWTDISTVSGEVHSDLEAVGAPADGQEHLELRAETISGDITLKRL